MALIRESKAFYFYFDWPKNVDNNLKHEIELVIKSNGYSYCTNISIETIFMNTENSKANEPHKFVLRCHKYYT